MILGVILGVMLGVILGVILGILDSTSILGVIGNPGMTEVV